MSKQAQLISGAVLSYALADNVTPDDEPATYTAITGAITSIPEMFSKPDTVDTTTIDNTTQTSIPALPGGDSLDFGVLLESDIYTAHAAIVASDLANGNTWYKLDFAAPLSRTIKWRGAVADNIVINGGASADLAEGVMPIYPSTDLTEGATA